MNDISSMLSMQAQLLILAAVGFVLKRIKVLSDEFRKAATDLLIDVILPCNIVASFEMEINTELLRECIGIVIASIVIQLICSILNKLLYRKISPDRVPVLKYGTITSNAGFLGSPLVESMMGGHGLLLASFFLIPIRIVMWTSGLSIFTKNKANRKNTIKKTLTHPCIVAVYFGLAFMILQVNPPDFINQPIKRLSSCTLPLSMILIGMIISEVRLKDFIELDVLYYCFIRLILIPFMTMLGCRLAGADEITVGVATVLTAMPMGATCAILAMKYNYNKEFATSCVAVSSFFSLFTTPLWYLIL